MFRTITAPLIFPANPRNNPSQVGVTVKDNMLSNPITPMTCRLIATESHLHKVIDSSGFAITFFENAS
jgi:hypothetical protein